MVEIIHPRTNDTPNGPRIQYAYDEAFRLVSITDPNGQAFLRNSYDDYGRITQQKHGTGTFEFGYEDIGKTDSGFPIYRTRVRLKNGALLDLKHDAPGHVVERTLFVSAGSVSPEDRHESSGNTVPLVTKSSFNRHSEIVSRTYPAEDTIAWTYDEDNTDPRARGNSHDVNQSPAPSAENGQTQVVTRYTYEPEHQQVESITDPRGNTTRFEYDDRGNLAKRIYPPVTVPEIVKEPNGRRTIRQAKLSERLEYNEAGQLIRFTNARGARVEYYYHPATDPAGAKSNANSRAHTQRAGGYLARIVRDPAGKERRLKSKPARLTTDYGYDTFGNLTTVLDGKGNPTSFDYDTHSRVVGITSRKPFNYKKVFRYDANGNLREATISFDHHQYDPVERVVVRKSTTARRCFEYDVLNNVVRQTVAADGREVTRTLVRDANGNIVREIQPMGDVVEYEYDERGLLITRRFGAGTKDEAEIHHTYTRNGRVRSTVDGCGNTVRYDYDGFDRYKGFANAGGTVKEQWRDETGNVTRIQVRGDLVTADEHGEPVSKRAMPLLESWFQYDELNRRVRMDRAWSDPLTGEPLGKSQWDGKEGVVSTVIEYDDNHLPLKVWQETGSVLNLQYDGANRPVSVSDETGESASIRYDENSNPVRVERLGPATSGDKKRFRQISNHEFDELDRLVVRSLNGGPPESFVYNALGLVTEYKSAAETSTQYLHDAFGRLSGRATTAAVPRSVNGEGAKQLLVQRVERDDNNRLVAQVNAANHSTRYHYDPLNRLSSVTYADGMARHFGRDGNGNTVRLVEPNRTVITNRFDAQDRLTERLIEGANGGDPQLERFHYDGLNRLVAAVTGSATTLRRYDSLSRLLEESQSGRAIRYGYDSAGNRVSLIYPGGQEVRKSYDALGRVTEVRDEWSRLIASYSYGSSGQLRQQQLGDVLKAAFTYEPGRDRISSSIYRSADTAEIIEGNKYRYDAVGNRIEEVQLRRGKNFGERYLYDSANRLVKVQYGVKRLSDPESPFEREVLYELSPAGIWQRKTTRDANVQSLEQAEGVANRRGRYLSLGDRRFEYDANGNRILEENGEDGEHSQKRYTYDYANRLVRVESLDADKQVVLTIEYSYDAFNRQVRKRVARDGHTREYERVWHNSQLIEEWENGSLAKSFVYGSRVNEPLKMTLHSGHEQEEYFYTFDGRGSVTALIDRHGKLDEAYRYDVFGQPFLSVRRGEEVNQSISPAASITNPLLTAGRLYDADTGLSVISSSSYDAKTAQTVDDFEIPVGPVQVGPPFSYPWTRDPYAAIGGMSKWTPPEEDEDYPASIGAHAAVGGIIIITGLEWSLGVIAKWHAPSLFWGALHLGWELFWEWVEHNGGHGPTGNGGHGSSGGQGGGGSSNHGGSSSGGHGGSSSGSWGRPSDQPEKPSGNGVDYGHEGGGSGDSSGGGSTGGGSTGTGGGAGTGNNVSGSSSTSKKQNQSPAYVHKDENGNWVYDDTGKPYVAGDMPNPEDSGGGDIDKYWWLSLPNRNIFDALKSGPYVDEREQTPYFSLNDLDNLSILTALTPQLITVDEGGEGITLNLQGVQSTSMSAGITTSDGWGDKPRSWAEAVAAPRIRDASTSRF